MSASAFRRCLEDCDIEGARRLWRHVSPHLPQPKSDSETLVLIHMTRVGAESIALKLRAYSHRWLLDHGYPSALPDELKSKAERLYPVIADAVGISVNTKSEILQPAVEHIRGAMSDAVLDAYADKKTDPAFVKVRMFEARQRMKKYFRDLFDAAALSRPDRAV